MSDLRLDGRVAVVTGAGQGIGREHALQLAARGASVVINDIGAALDGSGHSSRPANQVAAEIVAAGGQAVADCNTVATPEGGDAIIESALRAFGRIDILVNNAGNSAGGRFQNLTPQQIDDAVRVHLMGSFFVTRAAWNEFRRNEYGRVINTTSSSGLYGAVGRVNYQAAKAGLWGLTRGLAAEGAQWGIKVNAVAPWAVSRMTRDADRSRQRTSRSKDAVIEAGSRMDLSAELVSPLVVVLAHESLEATGQVYNVGGGRIGRYFIGTTEGFYHPHLTPELIREHFEEVHAIEPFSIFDRLEEELAALADRITDARVEKA